MSYFGERLVSRVKTVTIPFKMLPTADSKSQETTRVDHQDSMNLKDHSYEARKILLI